MQKWLMDLRRATRRLARSRSFTFPVVGTLALGLGSVAAIFSIVNAVLLRPLPYPDADRLVAIHHAAPGWSLSHANLSEATYAHYRASADEFESIAAYLENNVSLTDLDRAERVPVALVTPSLVSVLQVTPALGRTFTDADLGPGGEAVVMISYDLWVRRYGADPALIGRMIEANTRRLRVVGVLPRGLEFPRPGTAVWYADALVPPSPRVRDFYLGGIARLRPDTTSALAESRLRVLVTTMAGRYEDFGSAALAQSQLRPIVTPLKQDVISGIQAPLVILLCTMGLVLVISWANVANLFLVRGESRRREVSLQRALGASTADLFRGFLCESLILAAPAALIGVLVAQTGLVALLDATLVPIPRKTEIRLDDTVVAVTIALAIITSLALASLSLVQTGRQRLATALRTGGRQMTAGSRQRLMQRGLVSLQIALALIVVIGSAVMLQSLWRLKHVDLGFRTEERLTFSVSLIGTQYPQYDDQVRFHEALMEQLRQLPGVRDAAAIGSLPLTPTPSYLQKPVSLALPSAPTIASTPATMAMVTPNYFKVMGIAIRSGRGFDAARTLENEIPVLVSEALAARLAPGQPVVGRRLYTPRAEKYSPLVISGVVSDARTESADRDPGLIVYVPALRGAAGLKPQVYAGTMSVIVETSMPAASSVSQVRDTLHRLNPNLAIGDVRTMQTLADASMGRMHLVTMLLTIAASTGMLLAVVGVFGLTSHLVSQRWREMAVRVALGARPTDVTRLVLSHSVATIAVGIVAGILGSFIVTQSLSILLFDVTPRDALTFTVAPLVVLVIALVAGYLPARRAAQVNPAYALTME